MNYVDNHSHIVEVALLGDEPLREFVDGPRIYHRRLVDEGSSPMDDVQPFTELPYDALARVMDALNKVQNMGFVQLTEMGLNSWRAWDLLVTLDLPLKLNVFMASGAANLQRMQEVDNEQLQMRGVKFYADGWLGARTCAMNKPFADEPDNRGVLFTNAETLARRAHPFADAGFQVATHAIGDRAIETVLDAYELLYGSDCSVAAPRIEHCQFLSAEIIERIAAMGVVICIQPSFADSDFDAVSQALEPARAHWAYRWDLLWNAGARLLFGADAPIENLEPQKSISAAVSGRGATLLEAQVQELMTRQFP